MLSPQPKPTLKSWLMMLHIFGALVFFGIVSLEKLRLWRLSVRAKAATDEGLLLLFEELCGKIKLPRKPRLLISPTNHSPMTFGAWKPVVVLPQSLTETLPAEEVKVILGHELAHQRRWDLWLSWLQVPISAVWWFNPVYWILFRKIRSAREDCCDDLVVASGLASGEAYCETLLQAARVASGSALAGAALAYIDESHPLRRRLKRIMTSKLITAPRLAWTGMIIVVLLALLFLPGIRKRSGIQNPARATGEKESTSHQAANATGQYSPILPTDIQVRVVERATGRAIPNAALLVGSPDPNAAKDMVPVEVPHTDNDGRCTIPAPTMSPALINVRAEGYVPRRLLFRSGESMPHEYLFKLDKGGFIGGYVRDEAGRPLEDVKISIVATNPLLAAKQAPTDLEGYDSRVYTQTDRSGRWTSTEVVPDPERVSLTLEHPERARTNYDTLPNITVIGEPSELTALSDLKEGKADLVMKDGLMVAGRVTDDTGRGIEGCEVTHLEDPSRHIIGPRTLPVEKTQPDGRFAFRATKDAEVLLVLQAKGFAAESHRVKVVPGLSAMEFRLKKGEIVSGRVVDERGDPIPNAAVGTVRKGWEQPISWQGKTDTDGRFQWDSAPTEALSYTAGAAGYDPSSPMVLAPGKEHEIRLTKTSELIVTGKVTDAKTKMPIDAFKVSAVNSLQFVSKSVDGKSGEFSLSLPSRSKYATADGSPTAPPTLGILVEADGYLPDLSQSLEDTPGNRYLEVALVRGNGLSGVVILPDGNPAPNANVFLCGGSVNAGNSGSGVAPVDPLSGPMMMNSIKSIRCSSGPSGSPLAAVTETDASGRFSFKPVPQPQSIYAVHEKGFAAVAAEKVSASGNIMLQPWSRIEGVLVIGRKPGGNQSLSLTPLAPPRPPDLRASFTTATDDQGRFEFASVPPGEYRISHRAPPGISGQSAYVTARSGETTSLKIGGTGRPLIGRIVPTGPDPNTASKIYSASLSLKLPGDDTPDPTDEAAYNEWRQSNAYRAQQRIARNYGIRLDADGSFRLEDIPAGTYTLTVLVIPSDRPQTQPDGSPNIKRVTKEIVVSEMPGGRSDDPLDLGVITLQILPKK